jgi:outer membrane usher protein
MPWPTPNKYTRALLILAALCVVQVGLGDTPTEPVDQGAQAQPTSIDTTYEPVLASNAEIAASNWADRLASGRSDSVLNSAPAGVTISVEFDAGEPPGRRDSGSQPLLADQDFAHIENDELMATAGQLPKPRQASSGEPVRDDRLLLLDMTVNGTHRGSVLMMVDARGDLYAQPDTLAEWGVTKRIPEVAQHAGRTFHDFDALPGVQTQVNTRSMSGSAHIPAEYMADTTRSLSWDSGIAPRADNGAFLDYDLAYIDDPGLAASQVSGLFNPTVFTSQGNLSAGLLYRNQDGSLGAQPDELVRLDTTWTRDFPDKLSSLRVGDALTPANPWSRSLRFGGIQLATNFSTQPTLITFPQPSISGSAAVPTALDIFVNGSLRASEEVPDGTFRINEIPVVTGAGQIQVVTRDLLGREQLVVQDFYASQELLRPGLSDYSLSIGALRQNYSLESNNYSEMMVSAMLRRGLTSNLTVEGRVDGTGDVQVAGGSANYSMTRLGVFSAALALSHQDDMGALWQVGHQYQGRSMRFDLRFQGTSEDFAQPGVDVPLASPRLQSLVSAGTSMGNYGSLGMSFVDERFHDADQDRKVITLNYSRQLPYSLSLSLSGSYIQQDDSDLQASVVLMKFFGGRRSASASLQQSREIQSLRMEYRDDVAQGPGFGYRAAAYLGDNSAMEAETTWNTNYNRMQAEVRSLDGQTGWRAQASGSVAWLGNDFYANREIRDGFAVVDAGGFEGVRVYLENREMGVTDSHGRLMIPGLLPYQANRISIDSRDLPMTAQVTDTGEAVAPYYRSGTLVEFDVRDTRGALLRVLWPDGTPVPEGSQAQIDGQPEVYPVGRSGRLYLQGIATKTRVLVRNHEWQCHLELPGLAGLEDNVIPNLGDFTCMREDDE